MRQSRRFRHVSRALLTLLALRLLVPVGYMPAPLSDGGLVLCHDISAATLAMLGGVNPAARNDGGVPHDTHHGALAGHTTSDPADGKAADTARYKGRDSFRDSAGETSHVHGSPDDSPTSVHEAWERCAFGVAPTDAAIAHIVEVASAVPAVAAVTVRPALGHGDASRSRFRARAPPA